MKTLRIFNVFLLIAINISVSYSQTINCKEFHRRNLCYKEAYEPGFNYYGQSASAVIEKGMTTKYNAIFYGGKDYVVNMCTNMFFRPVHFTIYDADTQELIYDNEEDNFINKVMFAMEYTRSITLEITVLDDKNNDPKSEGGERDCLGVLILWRKTPKIGF